MIDATQYTALTGQTAPANFTTLVLIVVGRLSRALNRPLVSLVRTEQLTVYRDGYAYPTALPVTAAEGFEFERYAIKIGTPGVHEVTYTGGFVAFGSTASNACPFDLALAIGYGVQTLTTPTAGVIGAGVSSLAIAGEWTLTKDSKTVLGADGHLVPASLAELADLGGRCAVLAAGYRRVV